MSSARCQSFYSGLSVLTEAVMAKIHQAMFHQDIIGSDNGLSPGRRQAFIWTNAELSCWPAYLSS